MEGGKKRLQADTMRNATEKEIKELRRENEKMKVYVVSQK